MTWMPVVHYINMKHAAGTRNIPKRLDCRLNMMQVRQHEPSREVGARQLWL